MCSKHSLHGAPGYNLQTAVEAQSHLVVHHEVSADANDQRQLQPMAEAASQVLDRPCTVVADAGDANGEQIAALDAKGIVSYVALNRAVNSRGDGSLYDRSAFSYDSENDLVTRHLYEQALEANAQRLEILGNARLLMRGMKGAQAELSLAVLAYNLKRVFNMKGSAWMHQALQG